jgi:hypothetical protein
LYLTIRKTPIFISISLTNMKNSPYPHCSLWLIRFGLLRDIADNDPGPLVALPAVNTSATAIRTRQCAACHKVDYVRRRELEAMTKKAEAS